MIKKLILFVLAFIIGLIVGSARPYNGLNKGIAWNIGGIELYPNPALFLCEGNYNRITGEYNDYNIPSWLNEFIVDC